MPWIARLLARVTTDTGSRGPSVAVVMAKRISATSVVLSSGPDVDSTSSQ